MNKMIAVTRERIKMSFSVRSSPESANMAFGTIRETDATIIRDDIMFDRVLSNSRLLFAVASEKKAAT